MKMTRLFLSLAMGAVLMTGMASCKDEVVVGGAISGFVTDANTGEPLRAVDITLSPSGLSTISGSDGRYEFIDIAPDTYTVRGAKSGYITNSVRVAVTDGRTSTGDMLLTPSSADMNLSVGLVDFGVTGTVETFQIINNASNGSFQWTVTVQGAASWLMVSPTSGSTGAGQRSQVTLTANRSQLNTSDLVTLVVSNVTSGNSISLPVSISYNSGTLQVTPNPVDFGTSASSRQLTLKNTGSTNVPYEINYNCAWLTVSPTSGSIASGNTSTIALSLNRSAFTGTAETILQVRNTADGSSTTVRVTASGSGGGGGDDIVVSNGLMAYYTFDDGTTRDASDNGVDGQLVDGAEVQTESNGRQYLSLQSFQGSSFTIPHNLFSGYTHWTMSFWVKGLTAGNVFAAQRPDLNEYSDFPMLWADQN